MKFIGPENAPAEILELLGEDERSLSQLVEKVRACAGYEETVCVNRWCTSAGPQFFEVGLWEGASFIPLTPLWSSRQGAWKDAIARLGIGKTRRRAGASRVT